MLKLVDYLLVLAAKRWYIYYIKFEFLLSSGPIHYITADNLQLGVIFFQFHDWFEAKIF